MLGPVLRAEVGDTVRVVFRNNLPVPDQHPPARVFYDKNGEGAPYDDGTPATRQGRRRRSPTGGTHTYTWQVPRAGRAQAHGRQLGDVDVPLAQRRGGRPYAGLVGPIVVTRAGTARADGTPEGRRPRVFLDFMIDNENQSPLLAANRRRFTCRPSGPTPRDEDIEESNLMHAINGYVFGNMPMIDDDSAGRARALVRDGHGHRGRPAHPALARQHVTVNGMRTDVVSLLPATMVVADMVPDDVGTWLLHCHVNDHITAGMLTRYRVLP